MPNAAAAPITADPARRCVVTIQGLVQGVGVRPFIYRLAVGHRLAGSVRNTLQGVRVEIEGAESALYSFLVDLRAGLPDAGLGARWGEARGDSGSFVIAPSESAGITELSPTPDRATCEACLRDLEDARGPRYRYPFTTCAACGPRYSIVSALPYDRRRTTMAAFAMCARCRREYGDPADRRFHAETIACQACGPVLTIRIAAGSPGDSGDAIETIARALKGGALVAIKGLGGYHLACDATNRAAVVELRRRKRREAKPLAVMVKDLEAARSLCGISEVEAALLGSAARPIVLLDRHPEATIADEVSPRLGRVGLMLPYTPLHHLVLAAVDRPLVMTSGNPSDEPIAHVDEDALRRLGDVADLFATHDRTIHVACDDSVAHVVRGVPRVVRRARGYVPGAIRLPVPAPRPILALGGELKSTVALVRGGEAFLSQHLGDLTSERAFRGYLTAIDHLKSLFTLVPDVIAHDLHPAYRSTLHARSLDSVRRIAVQHHHAHVASCLADNGVDRPVIGVAWDGAGYGADGTVWGGEFLVGDLAGFTRAGHLENVPLPGGDAAVREPWRMAAAFLRAAYGPDMDGLDLAFSRTLDRAAWRVLDRAIVSGLNAPLTSSAGRLFDAVAGLLGVRARVSFEGQAAMELEALADRGADDVYATGIADVEGATVVRTTDIVRGVVDDLLAGVPAPRVAARFHATLVHVIVRMCEGLRQRTGIPAVALSGGVFQNAWLLASTIDELERCGFEVYTHRQVPTNDGGLALGQAAVAARRLAQDDA